MVLYRISSQWAWAPLALGIREKQSQGPALGGGDQLPPAGAVCFLPWTSPQSQLTPQCTAGQMGSPPEGFGALPGSFSNWPPHGPLLSYVSLPSREQHNMVKRTELCTQPTMRSNPSSTTARLCVLSRASILLSIKMCLY